MPHLLWIVPILTIVLIDTAFTLTRKQMTSLSARIWRIGLVSIFAINLIGSLPRWHKGIHRPVGEDAVFVCSATGSDDPLPIPVKDVPAGKTIFADTGKQVNVFLRYSFTDKDSQWFPRITLFGLALTATFSWLASKLRRPIDDAA